MMTGVTVMPESIQNEGVEAILDRLSAAGVTHVATSPYVMEPADEKTGSREPPIDAGAGSVRLLDRPQWGKRELFVRTSPSFRPDKKMYAGLRYQPSEPDGLTEREGPIIARFIRAAQAKHIQVYLQIQAAIPPGYRVQFGGPMDEDKPRLPDGRVPPRRFANNGSLASPHITNYTLALTRDLLRVYPDIDGIRYDWPEYPPYMLDDVFLDFNPQLAKLGGFDFERMQREAMGVYRLLHGGLTNRHLERWLTEDGGKGPLLQALVDQPGLGDWLRCKARLSSELAVKLRETLPTRMALAFGTFPPPFTTVSGFDFRTVATAFHVKLFTMHWPVILRFYGEQLKRNNPAVDEGLLVRALSNWLGIQDQPYFSRLEQFKYPEPEEAHPVGEEAQLLKIRDAQRMAGETPVVSFIHGYGPVKDFARRLQIGRTASKHGVWINRYEYLRNEKIAGLRENG